MSVVNETRNQTYERLARVAGSVGVDEAKVLNLLKIPDTPGPDGALNAGNQVTNDIKWIVKVCCFFPGPFLSILERSPSASDLISMQI